MTLLCFHTMGCGQSIRKKSKHKSEVNTGDNTYDNQTYGTTPTTGSALSKQSGGAKKKKSLSTEPDDNNHGNKLTNKPLSNIETSPSSRAKSGVQTGQINGDLRNTDQETDTNNPEQGKVRRDSGSGVGKSGLVVQSKMSASQLEFFRILDEKIEQGNDYDGNGQNT